MSELETLRAENQRLREACQMIVDVGVCMAFHQIHADWMISEVLQKHDVPNVQLLAKKAQDAAKAALGQVT